MSNITEPTHYAIQYRNAATGEVSSKSVIEARELVAMLKLAANMGYVLTYEPATEADELEWIESRF